MPLLRIPTARAGIPQCGYWLTGESAARQDYFLTWQLPKGADMRATGARLIRAAALVVLLLSAAAPAAHASTGARSASGAGNCGQYQCFYYASDFLNTRANPQPGQIATVPLASRVIGPAAQAPSLLMGLDNGPRAYWAVSDSYAQGRSGLVGGVSAGNVLNFDHWQYTDELYYYLHDTVSVPPTQWVNAAHRNGVPVLGTVTGDCGVCGAQATILFSPQNYRRTVTQLYSYASRYGFDGWIIDFEAGFDPTESTLAAVQLMTHLILPDGQRMRVAVYQAFEPSLPQVLVPYLQAGAQWQADYSPDTTAPQQTYQTLVSAGLALLNLSAFWSSYVYAWLNNCPAGDRTTTSQIWNGNPGPPECLNTASLFVNQRAIVPAAPGPGVPPYYTSTGLFAPEWTYFGKLPDPAPGQVPAGPASRTLAHAADDALWVGKGVTYTGQACVRSGTSNAVSYLITPRSVVGRLPFATNFNAGEGDVYNLSGQPAGTRPWNNLSAQDLLPTWSCAVSGNLTASIEYATIRNGDAYNGGSALRLTGHGAGLAGLYATRIPVAPGSDPVLSFTSKVLTSALPYVQVTYSDGTTETVRRPGPGTGWVQTAAPLNAQGKTITRISAGFPAGSGAINAYLGQLRIYDPSADATPRPISLRTYSPVLSWTPPALPAAAYWNVYANTGGCLRFLGPSFSTSYSVPQAMFDSSVSTTRYVIQPVSTAGLPATLGQQLCQS